MTFYDQYKLVPSNNDFNFFTQYILSDNKPTEVSSKAQKRLIEAKEFFIKELSDLPAEEILRLLNVLRNARVLIHIVNTNKEASQIFELVNDRGKALTDLESLKSFLMYRASLTGNDQWLQQIEENFADIYRTIETMEDSIDESQILAYYVIAFHKWKENEFRRAKDFIKEIVADGKIDIVQVSTDIKEVSQISKNLIENKKRIDVIDNLNMLGRSAIFMPLFIKVSKLHGNDDDVLREIAELSYKFALASSIAGLRSDTGVSYFYTLARDYNGQDKSKLIKEINQIFNENWWNIKNRLKNNINSIHYGNLARFLLFLYENLLRKKHKQKSMTIDDYFYNDLRFKLSIEHIISRDFAKKHFSKEFQNEYLNLLGNLVLDFQSPNSSKGNKPLNEKLEYFGSNNSFLSQQEIPNILERAKLEIIKKFNEELDIHKEEHMKVFITLRNQLIVEELSKIPVLKDLLN